MAPPHAPVPVAIRLDRTARCLTVDFGPAGAYALSAEYLRVESPSADRRGHTPAQRRLVHGRAEIGIIAVEPVGNYAIRLVFDDLHDTGIYSWDYLAELGREHPKRWAAYLAELAAAGLSRDPRAVPPRR